MAVVMGLGAVTATSITLLDAKQRQYNMKKKAPAAVTAELSHVGGGSIPMLPSSSSSSISEMPRLNTPPPRPDLPIYNQEEVAEHCGEDSLWYTFRGACVRFLLRFDVTTKQLLEHS